jgi:hypothetical protein
MQSTSMFQNILNKDSLLKGLEVQTGHAIGVELFHNLLIQQFAAKNHWSGLLDYLDSVWIQEINTLHNELPLESLVLGKGGIYYVDFRKCT